MQRILDSIWPGWIEPNLKLSAEDRRAIHREAWRKWLRNPWNLVCYGLLIIVYLVGIVPVRDGAGWLVQALGIGGPTAYRIARAAAVILWPIICFVGGGMFLQRVRFAPLVYQTLRERGHDVCSKCGYLLTGLPEEQESSNELDSTQSTTPNAASRTIRCPECGTHNAINRQPSHHR